MLELSDAWKSAYPGASVGVLAMQAVANPRQHAALEEKKTELESTLRKQYAARDRAELQKIPALGAYREYYRRFGKTYHVQHQLESVALKNRSIPSVAALVEVMFMAELKNLLLTAGHDLDAIEPPLRIDVAEGVESYVRLNGDAQVTKAGDMLIADAAGIVSCIIYGPDQRTRIRPETERVLFTVYAPTGIEPQRVLQHLEDLRENVLLIAPGASVMLLEVFGSV